jgi:hypothetical protein
MFDIRTMLVALFAVLGEAMAYSFVVFKKSVQNEGDTFNPAKAYRTLVIAIAMGLIAALIAAITGWPISDVTAWGTTTGFFAWATVVIDQFYSYATGPRTKADKDKLEEELKEDAEALVPVIEKAKDTKAPDPAAPAKVDSKDPVLTSKPEAKP